MRVVNYSEFRRSMASHLGAVVRENNELIVTSRGKKSVVVMRQADWERMKDTSSLLCDQFDVS